MGRLLGPLLALHEGARLWTIVNDGVMGGRSTSGLQDTPDGLLFAGVGQDNCIDAKSIALALFFLFYLFVFCLLTFCIRVEALVPFFAHHLLHQTQTLSFKVVLFCFVLFCFVFWFHLAVVHIEGAPTAGSARRVYRGAE
jgi:hypothetical protein